MFSPKSLVWMFFLTAKKITKLNVWRNSQPENVSKPQYRIYRKCVLLNWEHNITITISLIILCIRTVYIVCFKKIELERSLISNMKSFVGWLLLVCILVGRCVRASDDGQSPSVSDTKVKHQSSFNYLPRRDGVKVGLFSYIILLSYSIFFLS